MSKYFISSFRHFKTESESEIHGDLAHYSRIDRGGELVWFIWLFKNWRNRFGILDLYKNFSED